jgi:hypothetical protein
MRCLGFPDRMITPRRVASHHTVDSTAEEDPEKEIFRNLWRRKRLLPPLASPHSRRSRWQLVLLLFSAYEQLYIPMQLSFQLPRPASGGVFQIPFAQFIFQVCTCMMTLAKAVDNRDPSLMDPASLQADIPCTTCARFCSRRSWSLTSVSQSTLFSTFAPRCLGRLNRDRLSSQI